MSEKIKRLNVPIPASLHTELKITATIQDKTIAQWVIEAIQYKLQKEKEIEKKK